MKVYIDLFFLFNVIIDLIIIMGVSIILKRRCSYFKIILGSFVGGVISLFLFTSINKILIEIIGIIIICFISFGYKNIKYMLNNILYFYILSTLLGGIMYLFNIRVTSNSIYTYLIIVIIAIEVVILYVKEMNKMRNIYNNYYNVDIYFKNKDKLSLIGFVDTGNNLYDPYKKRPIIIVSSKYKVEDNFILVPYHTLSGDGILKCIKPNCIFIDGNIINKNLLVAFSDNFNFLDGVDVILHKDLMKG